jgi:hypothetical protein
MRAFSAGAGAEKHSGTPSNPDSSRLQKSRHIKRVVVLQSTEGSWKVKARERNPESGVQRIIFYQTEGRV